MQITVRFSHLSTRTPLLEVVVPHEATLEQLKIALEKGLAAAECCHVRVFNRWFIEELIHQQKRLVELTSADEQRLLSFFAIRNHSIIYLDGPLTDSIEGVGQALALLKVEMSQMALMIQQIIQNQRNLTESLNQMQRTQVDRFNSQNAAKSGGRESYCPGTCHTLKAIKA